MSPSPVGFAYCTSASLSSPGTGYVSLGFLPYRVSGGTIERLNIPGFNSLASVLATSDGAGWVSALDNRSMVMRFALGAAPTSYVIAMPTTPYQMQQSVDGGLWAIDGYGAQSRFMPGINSWSAVAKPSGVLHGIASTVAGGDEVYMSFWTQPTALQPLFGYINGGWQLVGDGGVRCLWSDSQGRAFHVNDVGAVSRLTPTGLTPFALNAPGCIGGAIGDELVSYGRFGLQHYRQNAWQSAVTLPVGTSSGISAMSMQGNQGIACGANALFTTTPDGGWAPLLRYDAGFSIVDAQQVLVRDDGHAMVIAGGQVWLLDGGASSTIAGLNNAVRLAQIGPDDFLVAVGSAVRRYTAGQLSADMPATFPWSQFGIQGLAVEHSTSAWAVGSFYTPYDGGIVHWNGTTWSPVAVPSEVTSFTSVTSFGGSTWVNGIYNVYQYRDGGWQDLGRPPMVSYVDSVVASGVDELFACSSNRAAIWSASAGWQTLAYNCDAADADPSTGTISFLEWGNSRSVRERSSTGVWRVNQLPGDPGLSHYVQIGVRGRRTWLVGPAGSAMLRAQ